MWQMAEVVERNWLDSLPATKQEEVANWMAQKKHM